MIKNIVMIMMLILNIISFSEVPHTYIYDNPDKAITTAETLKKKPNGAEMNISVTKVKTQEIEGIYNKDIKEIYIKIDELNITDKIIITDSLKDIKYPNRLMLSKSKYNYKYNYPDIDISTEGMALNSKLYIIVLDSTNNLKFIKKLTNIKTEETVLTTIVDNYMKQNTRSNQIIFEFKKDYMWNTNQVITGEHISDLTKEVEISFGAYSQPYGSHRGNNRTGYGRTFVDVIDANGTLIETKTFTWWTYIGGDSRHTINPRVYYTNKFDRPVIVKLRWSLDLGGFRAHYNGGRADMSVIRRVEQVFKYVVAPLEGTSNLSFDERYSKNFIEFNSTSYELGNPLALEKQVPGMSFSTSGAGIITMENGDILDINGTKATVGSSGNLSEKNINIGTLGLKYKVENGKLRLGLNSWGVLEPLRKANIKVIRGSREVTSHVLNIQAPKRIEGTSRINFQEYYPIDTYLEFNSVTLNAPVPLTLENSIKDVILESSNQHGIITMENGDILDINGIQNHIGASKNLSEKIQNINTLEFKYKVENGKLRIALTDWGILEPRRDIIIRIIRGKNEISKHIINIKAPIKVEGNTVLKFDNTYEIRNFAKFKGIDLSIPLPVSLENVKGVNLESTSGTGIPYMSEGDKIYISDNFTARRNRRSITNNFYQIGASGTLPKQNVKVTNGEVGIQVEGGKLNVALNNWTVNKNVNVRVQIVRGTNQIMDHTFTLKAPDAPFNVISQGVLDFGTIIAGAKNRAAETDIRIEMIKDVTDIQFKLNTDSPELYNKNGVTLRARNLQALVSKQSNRTYLVKIQGKLDIPKNQELGEYSGSAILEVRIK